ncbi:DUF3168 domain-containing protein [Pseudahrensia aquimaris]|uniref:DUF3168 domain-containing protein n=1 Tax=Pseudahrensia aquimaris TaxID=744461 RepID=A0ABW3FGA4_9HYPH
MSLSPLEDLHQGIFKTLSQSPELTDLLGGVKVYDRLPDRAKPPYLVIGDMTATDWSTATEPGEVISFTLHVWSRAPDRQQCHGLVDAVKALLHEGQIALTDHHLINLRCLFSEVSRDVSGRVLHGLIRFRAVTEPRA